MMSLTHCDPSWRRSDRPAGDHGHDGRQPGTNKSEVSLGVNPCGGMSARCSRSGYPARGYESDPPFGAKILPRRGASPAANGYSDLEDWVLGAGALADSPAVIFEHLDNPHSRSFVGGFTARIQCRLSRQSRKASDSSMVSLLWRRPGLLWA
jgi:hypothetical protein